MSGINHTTTAAAAAPPPPPSGAQEVRQQSRAERTADATKTQGNGENVFEEQEKGVKADPSGLLKMPREVFSKLKNTSKSLPLKFLKFAANHPVFCKAVVIGVAVGLIAGSVVAALHVHPHMVLDILIGGGITASILLVARKCLNAIHEAGESGLQEAKAEIKKAEMILEHHALETKVKTEEAVKKAEQNLQRAKDELQAAENELQAAENELQAATDETRGAAEQKVRIKKFKLEEPKVSVDLAIKNVEYTKEEKERKDKQTPVWKANLEVGKAKLEVAEAKLEKLAARMQTAGKAEEKLKAAEEKLKAAEEKRKVEGKPFGLFTSQPPAAVEEPIRRSVWDFFTPED